MTKINQSTISRYPNHSKISNITEVLRIRGGSGKKRPATGTAEGKPKRAKKASISDDEINALLNGKEFGFKLVQSNITSIFGKRDGSIDTYKKIVECIYKNKDALSNFIGKYKIFSSFKNISSMLHGAGNNAPKALTELLDVLTKKKTEITNSGLTTDNISSMLHGAGNNAPKALTNFLTDDNINNLKSLNKKYHILLISSGIKAPKRIKSLLIIQYYEIQNTPTTIKEILDTIDKDDRFLINTLEKFFKKKGLDESSEVNLETFDFDELEISLYYGASNEFDHFLNDYSKEVFQEDISVHPPFQEEALPPPLSPPRLSPDEYQGGFLNDDNYFNLSKHN